MKIVGLSFGALVLGVLAGCSSGAMSAGTTAGAVEANTPVLQARAYRMFTDFSTTKAADNSLSYLRLNVVSGIAGPVVQFANACEGLCPAIILPATTSSMHYVGPDGTNGCGNVFEGSNGAVQVIDYSACGSFQDGLFKLNRTMADGTITTYTSDDITPNDALDLGPTFRRIATTSGQAKQVSIIGSSDAPYSILVSEDGVNDSQTLGTDYDCTIAIGSIACTSKSTAPAIHVTRDAQGHFGITSDDDRADLGAGFSHVESI